jgi:hypothetical protein
MRLKGIMTTLLSAIVWVMGTLIMFSVTSAEKGDQNRVWHVCMQCSERDSPSISDALRRAKPHDTILVYWEPGFPYYMEHLVIDKPVRIISNTAAGDIMTYDLYPVIASVSHEVVRITVPGVELIGLNIMYLQQPADCNDEKLCYMESTGIRLDAPAIIRQVAITNCATGILAAYDKPYLDQASTIQLCRIGLPPDHGLTKAGFNQTRNHFGLVLLGCREEGRYLGVGRDRITDCQIMRNTQYGLVYTTANEPVMEGNLVEFNGKGPFKVVNPTLGKEQELIWFDQPDDRN